MMQQGTWQQAGLDEKYIRRFLGQMARDQINLHSVLLARGNNLFFERYWAPFTPEKPHRMYSVTKSFVSMAVGCLVDEGRLSLDDPIVQFFPDKLPPQVDPLLKQQTIRDMLMMCTCFISGGGWFRPDVKDRTAFYFSRPVEKPSGTLFDYDSNGSYILGALVERITGMPLLDYMKEKFLNRIGGFESARLLKTPDGTAWGDSALICTPRALMNFARLVMNNGAWEGEQLISRDYVAQASARQTDNNLEGSHHYNRHGYGYQIWRTEQNSFSFNGMGSQFAICVPDKDFIFVCTGDTQLNSPQDNPTIFRAVFDHLVDHLDGGQPAPEADLSAPLSLSLGVGEAFSPCMEKINGVTFRCDPNPMKITDFRLEWDHEKEGRFLYHNAQGAKCLPFGMKQNWFGKFPQLGYSNEYGNVHEITDFQYDCAVSAGWVDENKLQLRVQIIDQYLGILIITFAFRDDGFAAVRMMKCAEDFLSEYDGALIARKA